MFGAGNKGGLPGWWSGGWRVNVRAWSWMVKVQLTELTGKPLGFHAASARHVVCCNHSRQGKMEITWAGRDKDRRVASMGMERECIAGSVGNLERKAVGREGKSLSQKRPFFASSRWFRSISAFEQLYKRLGFVMGSRSHRVLAFGLHMLAALYTCLPTTTPSTQRRSSRIRDCGFASTPEDGAEIGLR